MQYLYLFFFAPGGAARRDIDPPRSPFGYFWPGGPGGPGGKTLFCLSRKPTFVFGLKPCQQNYIFLSGNFTSKNIFVLKTENWAWIHLHQS